MVQNGEDGVDNTNKNVSEFDSMPGIRQACGERRPKIHVLKRDKQNRKGKWSAIDSKVDDHFAEGIGTASLTG